MPPTALVDSFVKLCDTSKPLVASDLLKDRTLPLPCGARLEKVLRVLTAAPNTVATLSNVLRALPRSRGHRRFAHVSQSYSAHVRKPAITSVRSGVKKFR
jgi:hypothetical protein